MATSYTATNIQTQDYRTDPRARRLVSTQERIARLEQWLADRAGAEWTAGYKDAKAELEALLVNWNS